ncbi:MAG: hypothetical protein KAJ32_06780, partial [Gammaproteobacteria bacterium]|nr:hypothetical protein [Gammaproteobacteria bacterium]
PIRLPREKRSGCLNDAVLPTSRSDAPSGRTELNLPSLANFLYQHSVIQQTKRDPRNQQR